LHSGDAVKRRIQDGPEIGTYLRLITSSNIYHVSNFYTVRIGRKFVLVLPIKIPPHLNCVATLPCERSVS